MKFKDFKEKLLRKSTFRKEYFSRDLIFEISSMIAEARMLKGLTQLRLAKLMHTKQSSIARVENGSYLPSLAFLQKMAEAMDTYLIPPKFGFMEESHNVYLNEIEDANKNRLSNEMRPSDISWESFINNAVDKKVKL